MLLSVCFLTNPVSAENADKETNREEITTENASMEQEVVSEKDTSDHVEEPNSTNTVVQDDASTIEKNNRPTTSEYVEMEKHIPPEMSYEEYVAAGLIKPIPEEMLRKFVEEWIGDYEAKEIDRHWTNWEEQGMRKVDVASDIFTPDTEKKVKSIVLQDSFGSIASSEIADFKFSINSNGEVVTAEKIIISQEAAVKIASVYYDANKMGYWNGRVLNRVTYDEQENAWVCVYVKETGGGAVTVVVSETGELFGIFI